MAKRYRMRKKRNRKIAVLSICAVLMAGIIITFSVYAGTYYRADESVRDAVSGYDVMVQEQGSYTVIAPTAGSVATGYIFYPGARVEADAYLPYLTQVAEQGYFCVLLEVPLRLAILDVDAAAKPMAEHSEVGCWALGGHSLGGVVAAGFAATADEGVKGLVLLASYANNDLAESGLAVLSITAAEDGVLDWEKYEASQCRLPEQAQHMRIAGGNHSQFGMYGQQEGDGHAAITAEEQHRQTASATVALLSKL